MNEIRMTLRSPVCIAQKRGVGNAIETLDYIPGSTIRGALAMCYLKRYGCYDSCSRQWELTDSDKKAEFEDIFLSDDVQFGNAYIDGCRVIPTTAMSCKYDYGFWSTETHGVFDTVLPLAKYDLTGEFDESIESCPKCQSNVDRFSGYYKPKTKRRGATDFEAGEVQKRIIARTAITGSLETALHGSFYTLDVLNENQEFRAIIHASPLVINLLKDLIAQPNDRLRIGTAKTRALGEVHIKIRNATRNFAINSVKSRLEQLNAKADFTTRTLFIVTLQSDVILFDEILRCKTVIELFDLQETLAHQKHIDCSIFNQFEPLRSWTSTHRVSGWDVAKKRPKTDAIAITKGSVFVFILKENDPLGADNLQQLADVLEKIEEVGIGERRNEGFGGVRMCDEFHWEVKTK